MTNNWHNEKNSVIENWNINNSRKDDRKPKATKRPITIAYKDNKKDFDERKDYSYVVQKKAEMIEVDKENLYRNNARRRCHGKNMYRS